ncbi:MAG: N-6 DNA methylase [Pseudomonadota bacterium]
MFDKTRSDDVDEQKNAEVVPVKNIAKRQEFGAYYTPLHVAEILAKWAIRDENESVLEPCFGGCDFLEAIRARFAACGQTDFESHTALAIQGQMIRIFGH